MALNKLYVQTQIASADPEDHKSSVRFATTGALASYNRVGNVITATANGALADQDGVSPAEGDDMLLTTGTSAIDNGVYTVTQLGDGSNPFILTRRDDANTDQFVTSGMRVPVEEGTLYAGQIFVLTTPNPITLNTTELTFEQVSVVSEDYKNSVRFATTGVLPTYNRVGNVITASSNGALPDQDGVTPVVDDDFLLQHGAAAEDNGIYTVTQLGDGSNPFILTRRTDSSTDQLVTSGMQVTVEEGALYTGKIFVLTTANPITLNTTGLTFEVVGGSVEGSPVTIDGVAESVPDTRRMVYADDIQIEDDGDLVPDGDTFPTTSFDNHIINKVPSRQTRIVHEHEVMFIAPDLVVDGELVVDGQLEEFPEVPVSTSNVLDALASVLDVGELLGRTNPIEGIGISTVRDQINDVVSAAQVSHAKTGTVDGYAFVDAGGAVTPWLKAEAAFVDAYDFASPGLIIRGLYVDTSVEGFVAKKVIVNTSYDGHVTLVADNEVGADDVEAYRISIPDAYAVGADSLVLPPGEAVTVVYNPTISRWVVCSPRTWPKQFTTFISAVPYDPFPGDAVDVRKWLVSEVAVLYPSVGNATLSALSRGTYVGVLDTVIPAKLTKILINRTTASYTVTLEHDNASDSNETIYTNTQKDIVLGRGEMALAAYSNGKWYTSKLLGVHAASHENGGDDEIDVTGLSGTLADPQTPDTHASSHENGGGDEISVAGLSGLLADDQNPTTHASSHENGGGDEIDVGGLSGTLADPQTPVAHDLGGSEHSADTLADVNTKISDATLFGSAYGEMYQDDNATATTLAAEPSFTRLAGTYSSGLLSSFSLANGSGGSAGALEYTGSLTKTFQVVVSLSGGASSADTIVFRIAVNGTTVAKSEARRYMSGSNDEGVAIVTALVSLAQNDYVEIFAARAGGSANVTVDELNVNVVAVG